MPRPAASPPPTAVCLEVQLLRTFVYPATRRRLMEKLVTKYARGRRSASDVLLALAALRGQMRHAECDAMLSECLEVVAPVPTALWAWACANVRVLGCTTLRTMLRMAADRDGGRYLKHLYPHRHALASSPDGLVALMHESHRFPWAAGLVAPTLRTFVDTGRAPEGGR